MQIQEDTEQKVDKTQIENSHCMHNKENALKTTRKKAQIIHKKTYHNSSWFQEIWKPEEPETIQVLNEHDDQPRLIFPGKLSVRAWRESKYDLDIKA